MNSDNTGSVSEEDNNTLPGEVSGRRRSSSAASGNKILIPPGRRSRTTSVIKPPDVAHSPVIEEGLLPENVIMEVEEAILEIKDTLPEVQDVTIAVLIKEEQKIVNEEGELLAGENTELLKQVNEELKGLAGASSLASSKQNTEITYSFNEGSKRGSKFAERLVKNASKASLELVSMSLKEELEPLFSVNDDLEEAKPTALEEEIVQVEITKLISKRESRIDIDLDNLNASTSVQKSKTPSILKQPSDYSNMEYKASSPSSPVLSTEGSNSGKATEKIKKELKFADVHSEESNIENARPQTAEDEEIQIEMAKSISARESRRFDDDILNEEVQRLKEMISNDFLPVANDSRDFKFDEHFMESAISYHASDHDLNSTIHYDDKTALLSTETDNDIVIKKLDVDSPSKRLKIYPERGMRDNTTQTHHVASRGRRGTNPDNRMILPSQKLNAMDYIKYTTNDRDADLKHTTLGRKDENTTVINEEIADPNIIKTAIVETPVITYDPERRKSKNKEGILEQTKKNRRITAREDRQKRRKMTVVQRWLHDFSAFYHKRRKDFTKGGLGFIWKDQLRFIESRYGTGVVTYFALYRWVFLLNVFFSFIWFIFIIMFGIINMSQNNNAGWKEYMTVGNGTLEAGNLIQQLFSGKDNIQKTFFFYGSYPAWVSFSPNGDSYRLDTAYYIVIFVFYLLTFLLIIWRMRALFVTNREFYDNISVDRVSPFGTVVFSTWDYSIRDNEAKTNRNYAISTLLKTLISALEVDERKKLLSKSQALSNIYRRILSNVFVLMIFALSSVIIWFSILIETNGSLAVIPESFQFISPSAFVISLLTFLLPIIFQAIAKYERYTDPSTELKITLARSYVAKIATIYIILLEFYFRAGANSGGLIYAFENIKCWENNIGQVFYQLVWTNLILNILGTVSYGLFVRYIYGREKYDFGIADNILEIIYRQGLIWVGTIYSPMIIIINILSGWVIFYVKIWVITACGVPPKRIYNSYQQNIYFLFFLLITLALMAIPVFYALTTIPPSCGPFGPTQQYPALSSAYEIIPRGIQSLSVPTFRNILNFLGSLSFTIPVIIVLSIWIYYLVATAEKKTKSLKQLQYEVNTERADKRFLLRYYKVKM